MPRKRPGSALLAAAGAGALLAARAPGQSFNIDFGEGLTLPNSAYGAVGMAGIWNPADFQILAPSFLTDIHGNFNGAWILSLDGPLTSGTLPDPNTSGNIEALLDDGLFGTGDVFSPLEIAHIDAGRYLVIAYAIRTAQPNQLTLIEVSSPVTGRRVAATVGGPWAGQLVEGVSHARFGITAPDGVIRLVVAGGFWGQSGFCNGLQLVKVCDADLTTSAIAGQPGFGVPSGSLSNDDFFYFLDRFAAQDAGEADLTATAVPGSVGYGMPNGIINNDDFFYYLALFTAGC